MATLYRNFLAGTTTDAPLSDVATTINSAAFANLPTVASPDVMWLVLDPLASAGAPEIVQVTTHTAAATVVTVLRAQQTTTARSHAVGTVWRHALTHADLLAILLSIDDIWTDVDAIDLRGRGVVGHATTTATQTATTTVTDITDLTVTWTATASRLYRYSYMLTGHHTGTGEKIMSVALTDGAGTLQADLPHVLGSATGGDFQVLTGFTFSTGLSGSVTRKMRFSSLVTALALDHGGSRKGHFLVEDIGPA